MVEIRSRFPVRPHAAYDTKVAGRLVLPFDARQKKLAKAAGLKTPL